MLDWLKTILGEAYSEEIDKKVSEEIGKNFVARSDFNTLNTEKKTLADTVKERDEQLETLKASTGDVEALKTQIATLQTENATATKAHEAEIKQVRFDAALELALTNAKAKLPKAVKSYLDIDPEKAEFAEDGSIVGLSDLIKKLQESEDTKILFESEKVSGLKGAKPAEGKDGPPASPDTSKMTYSELAKYMAEHPEAKI